MRPGARTSGTVRPPAASPIAAPTLEGNAGTIGRGRGLTQRRSGGGVGSSARAQERVDGLGDARGDGVLARWAGGNRGFKRIANEERLDDAVRHLSRRGGVAGDRPSEKHSTPLGTVR